MCELDGWWKVAVLHSELSLALCNDLKGWERRGGREAQEGGICAPCGCLVAILSSSCATPWTVARQASLRMGFPKQEY